MSTSGLAKPLFLASLSIPASCLWFQLYEDTTVERILLPLVKDLLSTWALCTCFMLVLHIYKDGFRIVLSPLYLLVCAQVAVIISPVSIIPAPLKYALYTYQNGISIQLLTILVCAIMNRFFSYTKLYSLHNNFNRNKNSNFKCSYINVVWKRIVSNEEGGIMKRLVRIYYPCDSDYIERNGTLFKRSFYTNDDTSFVNRFFGLSSWFFDMHLVPMRSFISRLNPKFSKDAIGLLPKLSQQCYQFPVMVVYQDLNGHQAHSQQIICEKLAESGWIVVSAQAPNVIVNGSAVYTPFMPAPFSNHNCSDDLKVHYDFPVVDDEDEDWRLMNVRMKQHALDISFIVDSLMSIQFGQSMFGIEDSDDEGLDCQLLKGRLDLERLCVMGHSSSAATCIYTAASDRRIRGIISLDAWMYSLSADVISCGSPCPILFLQSGSKFFASEHEKYGKNNDQKVRDLVSNGSVHSYLYRMKQRGHYDCLDICILYPPMMKLLGYLPWSVKIYKSLTDGRTYRYGDLVTSFCNAFLNRHLRRDYHTAISHSHVLSPKKYPPKDTLHLSPAKKISRSPTRSVGSGFLRMIDGDSGSDTDHQDITVQSRTSRMASFENFESTLLDSVQTEFPNLITLTKMNQ